MNIKIPSVFEYKKDKFGKPFLKVSLTDYALITNPLLNKGMAFTEEERVSFDLLGLLPPHVTHLENQCARSYLTFKNKPNLIEQFIYLRELQDSNETLYYYLLSHHLEELIPVIYTPTVGVGCQQFSYVYRRPRGLFIAYPYRGSIDKILAHPRFNNTQVIVVSDGERILGLGDQGAGGMGIPIGKLVLYTACAGLHPTTTLPILLDTGTNNESLLNDPLYIGWHHERIRGKDYDDFVDEFVQAVHKRFPHVLLHWEDFAQINANPILMRYREQLCTFNDDIQGTAAVVVGALFAAIQSIGSSLLDQRIVVFGAGSAGTGISSLILRAMVDAGIPDEIARKKFYLVDKAGLLTDNLSLLDFQKPFAQPQSHTHNWKLETPPFVSLFDVVKNIHPTILIGVSGQGGIFSEHIVREMAAHVEQPIIFPLSNPTDRSEATPCDLMRWTNDKVVLSTGSPFPPIIRKGKHFRVDQTNNAYIFPGLGLGVIAVQAKLITEDMFMAAAKALAAISPAHQDPTMNLLPVLADSRHISFKVAIAVANEAINAGLATFKPTEDLETHIRNLMWTPEYLPYQKGIVK